jgi:hypothetical protein
MDLAGAVGELCDVDARHPVRLQRESVNYCDTHSGASDWATIVSSQE